MRSLLSGLLALAVVAGAPAFAAPAGTTATLAAIGAVDRRGATIGHRPGGANLAWCARTEWRHGLVLLGLSDVAGSLQSDALRTFGRARGPGIMALAANGPAERAGLRPGDVIAGLEDRPLPAPGGAPGRESQL